MKTHDLIAALAVDMAPVDASRADRWFMAKLVAGGLVAMVAMMLGLGPRSDIASAVWLPMFWLKLAFPAALAIATLVVLRRLAHPGMRLGRSPLAVAAPVALVWLMAGAALLMAGAGERLPLILGETWTQCPVSIAVLSIPATVLAFWALRGMAPTRLSLAGGVAGLFGGAAAALAYALHCPEMGAPFLAVWYVLGMLVPAGVGTLLGRRLLRW
ncbi:MAG TPA: DUF1109 domain-containing protein [Ramlibacter sp.]|nr:DUF1109 domain-containing protein [Ramlibacter sp.]